MMMGQTTFVNYVALDVSLVYLQVQLVKLVILIIIGLSFHLLILAIVMLAFTMMAQTLCVPLVQLRVLSA